MCQHHHLGDNVLLLRSRVVLYIQGWPRKNSRPIECVQIDMFKSLLYTVISLYESFLITFIHVTNKTDIIAKEHCIAKHHISKSLNLQKRSISSDSCNCFSQATIYNGLTDYSDSNARKRHFPRVLLTDDIFKQYACEF